MLLFSPFLAPALKHQSPEQCWSRSVVTFLGPSVVLTILNFLMAVFQPDGRLQYYPGTRAWARRWVYKQKKKSSISQMVNSGLLFFFKYFSGNRITCDTSIAVVSQRALVSYPVCLLMNRRWVEDTNGLLYLGSSLKQRVIWLQEKQRILEIVSSQKGKSPRWNKAYVI